MILIKPILLLRKLKYYFFFLELASLRMARTKRPFWIRGVRNIERQSRRYGSDRDPKNQKKKPDRAVDIKMGCF